MKEYFRFIHNWAWVILLIFCTAGLVYPVIGLFAVICMAAPVAVAFFKGRLWCGLFCPRGSFNDVILSKISPQRDSPDLFRTKWFPLVFMAVIMTAFIIQLIPAWGSLAAAGAVFVRMIIITTFLAIILGAVYNQRSWCRICPMGTMAEYAASTRKRPKPRQVGSEGTVIKVR